MIMPDDTTPPGGDELEDDVRQVIMDAFAILLREDAGTERYCALLGVLAGSIAGMGALMGAKLHHDVRQRLRDVAFQANGAEADGARLTAMLLDVLR